MKPQTTEKEKPKYWQKAAANLLKNAQSGRYYARFVIGGKPTWVNLDTDVFTVAKLRLADERARVERNRLAIKNAESGVATLGQIAEILKASITSDATITESTRELKMGVVAMVFRTWPELASMRPDALTKAAVVRWRDRLARDGTGHILPGAKGRSERADGSSPSRINKGIDVIRAMLGIAVEKGQVSHNWLVGRRLGVKLPMASKKPRLPESSVLESIFRDIEKRRPASAELCRFLAYTGCRLREAQGVTWGDIDLDSGMMQVRGTKTESSNREVPLIPTARNLLTTIKARRAELGLPTDEKTPVLSAHEAGIGLRNACERAGVERLTHHDLRDAFATACIESGVLVPTVAEWLGHKDRGALLLKTYKHHRREHSLAQAAKVVFA